jgi:hypothetical protein
MENSTDQLGPVSPKYSNLQRQQTQDCRPGSFSVVPSGLIAVDNPTQDYVLGYSQPSLRD